MTHSLSPQEIALPDGDLVLYEKIELAPALMDTLVTQTDWVQEQITLFGRTMPQPRLIAYHGDSGAAYTYSRKCYVPKPWTTCLTQLRETVQTLSGASFNSVLLNYYRDGNDSMGLHADDEPELGNNPIIASLSLGEERKIFFQHKNRRDLRNLSLALPDTSLLIMKGATQHHWKHGVRKVRGPCGPRLNLTFRFIHFPAQ